MSTAFDEIKQKDAANHMLTYARYDLALKSGKGALALDANGLEYIDFTSGIGVNSLGFCDDGWVDAVSNQAKTLQHTSNLYYNEPVADLTEKLISLTKMSKAFLCNSGAEANECAIKIARKYSFDKYGAGRHEIISLVNSFHGRTLATLTATGQDVMHPECFQPYFGGFKYAVSGDMDDFIAKADKNTCAVIIEMIQGEGGVIPQDKDYVKSLVDYCKDNHILVIVDEVQTGMGRTGKLLSYEHYGFLPDIVTLAKGLGGGLPIGACLCATPIDSVMTPGSHGSTFGGNPVVCAGALYVLDKISDTDFLDEVTKKGQYMRDKINNMKNVKSTRGMGLMIGIEVENKTSADVLKRCIEKGLMVLTAKSLVRLLPPLNISYEEIDKGLEILKTVLAE